MTIYLQYNERDKLFWWMSTFRTYENMGDALADLAALRKIKSINVMEISVSKGDDDTTYVRWDRDAGWEPEIYFDEELELWEEAQL
jgi:hypothetical protein